MFYDGSVFSLLELVISIIFIIIIDYRLYQEVQQIIITVILIRK